MLIIAVGWALLVTFECGVISMGNDILLVLMIKILVYHIDKTELQHYSKNVTKLCYTSEV